MSDAKITARCNPITCIMIGTDNNAKPKPTTDCVKAVAKTIRATPTNAKTDTSIMT
jgi:hypothetical protein